MALAELIAARGLSADISTRLAGAARLSKPVNIDKIGSNLTHVILKCLAMRNPKISRKNNEAPMSPDAFRHQEQLNQGRDHHRDNRRQWFIGIIIGLLSTAVAAIVGLWGAALNDTEKATVLGYFERTIGSPARIVADQAHYGYHWLIRDPEFYVLDAVRVRNYDLYKTITKDVRSIDADESLAALDAAEGELNLALSRDPKLKQAYVEIAITRLIRSFDDIVLLHSFSTALNDITTAHTWLNRANELGRTSTTNSVHLTPLAILSLIKPAEKIIYVMNNHMSKIDKNNSFQEISAQLLQNGMPEDIAKAISSDNTMLDDVSDSLSEIASFERGPQNSDYEIAAAVYLRGLLRLRYIVDDDNAAEANIPIYSKALNDIKIAEGILKPTPNTTSDIDKTIHKAAQFVLGITESLLYGFRQSPGDTELALDKFHQVDDLVSGDAKFVRIYSYFALLKALNEARKYDVLLVYADRFQQLFPNIVEIKWLTAETYANPEFKRRDLEKAIASYNEIIQMNSALPMRTKNLIYTTDCNYRDTCFPLDCSSAFDCYTKNISSDPPTLQERAFWPAIQYIDGRIAYQSDLDYYKFMSHLAEYKIFMEQGNIPAALDAAESVAFANSADPVFWTVVGLSHLVMYDESKEPHHLERALHTLNLAYQLDPSNPSILYNLGAAKIRNGNRKEGLQDVKEAHRLDARFDVKHVSDKYTIQRRPL